MTVFKPLEIFQSHAYPITIIFNGVFRSVSVTLTLLSPIRTRPHWSLPLSSQEDPSLFYDLAHVIHCDVGIPFLKGRSLTSPSHLARAGLNVAEQWISIVSPPLRHWFTSITLFANLAADSRCLCSLLWWTCSTPTLLLLPSPSSSPSCNRYSLSLYHKPGTALRLETRQWTKQIKLPARLEHTF